MAYFKGAQVRMLVPSEGSDHRDREFTMPVGSIGIVAAVSPECYDDSCPHIVDHMMIDIPVNSHSTITVIYDREDDGDLDAFLAAA